jgi:tetratricopeptide (TPR) repeat protein
MAAKLNVAHVLEGSVRKSGNQLRITTQLIEVDTDKHLWSETYDRELKSVFAIQDEIAAAVVDALKVTLLGEIPKANETDTRAYTLYLQARHVERQRTAESSKQAETLLLQALEIDPKFASAWAELGAVYFRPAPGEVGNRSMAENEKLSRHAVQQALSIDPQNSRAKLLQDRFKILYDWDFTAVSRQLKIMQLVLESNPSDVAILSRVAGLNMTLGRVDEAIDLRRQMVVLDPLSSGRHLGLSMSYLAAHRLEEAADSLQMARSLLPGRGGLQYRFGLLLLAQGDAPAALVAIEQETSGLRQVGMAIVQHALGDDGASELWLQEVLTCCAAEAAFQIAYIYAYRRETDNAFEWLELAYDNRDPGLVGVLTHPMLANLYDDPRWELLLDKMGLPH